MRNEQPKSQPGQRRRYDEEFKRNAVELLERGERSAVQLSRELGVSDCSLGKWKRQYGKQPAALNPVPRLSKAAWFNWSVKSST